MNMYMISYYLGSLRESTLLPCNIMAEIKEWRAESKAWRRNSEAWQSIVKEQFAMVGGLVNRSLGLADNLLYLAYGSSIIVLLGTGVYFYMIKGVKEDGNEDVNEDGNEDGKEDVNEDGSGSGGAHFVRGDGDVVRDLIKQWECPQVRKSEEIDNLFSDCISILPTYVRNSKFFLEMAALQKPKKMVDNSIFLKAKLNEVGNLFGWMIRLRVPTEVAGVLVENFCKVGMVSRIPKNIPEISPISLEMEPSGTGYLWKYWQNGKAMAPYNELVNKKVLVPVALGAVMIQKNEMNVMIQKNEMKLAMIQKKTERKLVDLAVKIMKSYH